VTLPGQGKKFEVRRNPTVVRFGSEVVGSRPEIDVVRTVALLVAVAGLLGAVGLGWATPDPFAPNVDVFHCQFIVLEWPGALLSLAILLLTAVVSLRGPDALDIARFFSSHRILIAASVTGMLCAGAIWIYRVYPLSMDEYAMLFQAKIFANGHRTVAYSPSLIRWLFIPAGIDRFFSVSLLDGRVASHYWPGFSLLLTPFVRWRLAWLLNPLIAFGSLLLLWRITREILDSTTAAGLAILFTIASPAFTVNAISLFSMNAHLFFNLAFVAFLLRPTPARLLGAGCVGSIAIILHNPLPHFLFALPWLLWIGSKPQRVRNLALLALGYLPLTLGVGAAWVVFRGTLSGTIDPGSVSVSELSAMIFEGGRWLSFPSMKTVGTQGMYVVELFNWTVPGLVPLAVLGGWRLRHNRIVRLLAASVALTLLAYWFVPFNQGHGWGFRYFHPVWGALPVLAAGALLRYREGRERWRNRLAGFAVTAALLSLVFGNGMRMVQVDRFIERRLSRRPVAQEGGRQVCFVSLQQCRSAGDLVKNDPYLRDPVVYFRSRGERADARFVRRHFSSARLTWSGSEGSCWTVEDPAEFRGIQPAFP